MATINSIKSLVLDLPPSCIEFCPDVPSCFVVGTYFLERKEQEEAAVNDAPPEGQKRTGSLIVFELNGDEVTQKQVLPTPYAILDVHFSPHDPEILCVAASTGLLDLYRLDPATQLLHPSRTLQLFDPTILVLSLSWHPKDPNLIGITTSAGGVHLVNLSKPTSSNHAGNTENDNEETSTYPSTEIHTHDLEAWTLSFSLAPGTSLFSGGDDATLRFSDRITPTSQTTASAEDEDEDEDDAATRTQWSDRRAHGAGVTAILPLRQSHALEESNVSVLLTGSYDDYIRVIRAPNMGRRQVLAEENLGGGVWRLKTLREDVEAGRYTILASCMHAGTRVVEVHRDGEDQWHIEVLAKFEEHKSMNYGSDVQPTDDRLRTIVSTSFYDKLLCLWRYELS